MHKSGESLATYLNNYLRHANYLPPDTISALRGIFEKTIELAEKVFGESAFWLFRKRERGEEEHWRWLERPTIVVYDPLMCVLSQRLEKALALIDRKEKIRESMEEFYKKNYATFEGRNVNPSALGARETAYREWFEGFLE